MINTITGLIIGTIIFLVPVWVIFKKAGYSPFLSLLGVVPLFGMLVQMIILAFGSWPVLKEARAGGSDGR